MLLSSTLLIKHLPSILTDNEKEDLLKHFGAKEVKCISSKQNKYNLVFAKFEDKTVAENVLHRLHQINVLGSRLSVEFAKKENINSELPKQHLSVNSTKEDKENEKYYKQFIDKLTSWYSNINFTQPVPSHLKYQYPPPDMQTLTNIIKVLATVPKFYTQVLHLMNKMNLPCPFGRDILPDVELPFYSPSKDENYTEKQDDIKKDEELVESSESEISSDEESKNLKETIPQQYKVKKKTKIKVPKFFKPPLVTPDRTKKRKTTFEEVFEKVPEEPKKIKLAQPIPLNEVPVKPVVDVQPNKKTEESDGGVSGFGFIHPIKKAAEEEPPRDIRDEREEERLEKEEIVCISEEELAGNRMSEKDRSVLPVFKNYAEGAPTCRLYIKNLAKTVSDQDLRYIYNRYLTKNIEDEPNMFDIRLMQEGRMKGQAFVTLQSVELAQKALKETNGYILKDKPLVVQFARSATK